MISNVAAEWRIRRNWLKKKEIESIFSAVKINPHTTKLLIKNVMIAYIH